MAVVEQQVDPPSGLCERYLDMVDEPNDLVVWDKGSVIGLYTLRIAAVLFSRKHRPMVHSMYNGMARKSVTLLDLAVRFGEIELAEEFARHGCTCTLESVSFFLPRRSGDGFPVLGDDDPVRDDLAFHSLATMTLSCPTTWRAEFDDDCSIQFDPWGRAFLSDTFSGFVFPDNAWCWSCTSSRRIPGHDDLHEEALSVYWDMSLRVAQARVNIPSVRAAFAVARCGGPAMVAHWSHPVKVLMLDAAVLLGMPATVTLFSQYVSEPRLGRILTLLDMVRILLQPVVLDALLRAGAGFSGFRYDVSILDTGGFRYYSISLFDVAILRGLGAAANLLARAQMHSFSLRRADLQWIVRGFMTNPRLTPEEFKIASPSERWEAANMVARCALSRVGARFGSALTQLIGSNRMPTVHNILGFVVDVPPALLEVVALP